MSSAAEDKFQDVPTFVECVVGYRAWRADDEDQLWPVHSARRPWRPGANTARCNCRTWDRLRFDWALVDGRRVLEPVPAHVAPDANCVCGLYSLRHLSERWYRPGLLESRSAVVGAVACWGRIQVHSDGFRAEHACVVTLARPQNADTAYAAGLRRIAARYRADLVPLSELEAAASEHGSPLPEDLRPPGESGMPNEDPAPAPVTPHAPDATIEEVGSAPPKIGFDGKPFREPWGQSGKF